MVEVSLTVGKLDASLALLLTKDHHLIEFPTILLPDGISTGSIVKITCERDLKKEEEEKKAFNALQEEIFEIFGKHEPQNPVLKIVNITQTSCVLEWEPLNLGTAELKELTLYKNGSKLGPIKNPFQKKNIKFSGLPIDTPYKFQLKLETSSGIYYSNLVELRTHKMTDLSGITLCIGDIDYNEEKFGLKDIEEAIKAINAKPYSTQVRVDTTQFICTKNTGIEYQKAKNMNIPIIRPEWIKACQLERRIVGVNKFYLDTENPIWKTKDFWAISNDVLPPPEEPAVEAQVARDNDLTIPDITIDHESEAEVTVTEPVPESNNTSQVAGTEIGTEAETEAETAKDVKPSEADETDSKIKEEPVPEEKSEVTEAKEGEEESTKAASVGSPEIENENGAQTSAATEPSEAAEESLATTETTVDEAATNGEIDTNKPEGVSEVDNAAETNAETEKPIEEEKNTLSDSVAKAEDTEVAKENDETSAIPNPVEEAESKLVTESETSDIPAEATPSEPEAKETPTENEESEEKASVSPEDEQQEQPEGEENGDAKAEPEKKNPPSSKGNKKKGKKKGKK